MTLSETILYYSTNTFLSYYLSMEYYKKFFVWCSPVFDPTKLEKYNVFRKIPPSSSPYAIYNVLHNDVSSCDLHSTKINENKTGLIKGASIHFTNNIITEQDYARILNIIDKAQIRDFYPLVFIIPKSKIKNKLIRVKVECKANPLSTEYQIHDLKRNEFDMIELKGE